MQHRGKLFLVAALLASLFAGRVALSQQVQPNESKSTFNAARCDWLLSNLGSAKAVSTGQQSVLVESQTAQKLGDLRGQLTHLGVPGIVVYAPIIANGAIAMVRLESRSSGQEPIVKLQETDWSRKIFRTAIAAAQQPGGDFFKRDLHRNLVSGGREADTGKSTFLFDPESYGLAPQALGLEESVLLGSTDISRAIANLSSMKQSRLLPSKFGAIFGLPASEDDYHLVFGTAKHFGELSDWQKSQADALNVASQHGIKVIAGSHNLTASNKADLLHEIEKQTGIVFIVAHADGARIVLPGHKAPIEITPSDISSLQLKENPLVILRICQGEDHGFANAFIKAGAVGVWSNRGVIRADVAVEQVRMFLDEINKRGNTLEAIAHVMSQNAYAAANSTLFTRLEINSGVVNGYNR